MAFPLPVLKIRHGKVPAPEQLPAYTFVDVDYEDLMRNLIFDGDIEFHVESRADDVLFLYLQTKVSKHLTTKTAFRSVLTHEQSRQFDSQLRWRLLRLYGMMVYPFLVTKFLVMASEKTNDKFGLVPILTSSRIQYSHWVYDSLSFLPEKVRTVASCVPVSRELAKIPQLTAMEAAKTTFYATLIPNLIEFGYGEVLNLRDLYSNRLSRKSFFLFSLSHFMRCSLRMGGTVAGAAVGTEVNKGKGTFVGGIVGGLAAGVVANQLDSFIFSFDNTK
eukprot:TRINITY_DN1777_c0_g2_i5.p1 TRINITY_DN1777_c0_g2~~TRINITY_DN1777_c0_g2_i5.p1  ORF type:complete len:275 (-),score=87.28 TRINITY_DN1777_c0_g2_i5:72-896(-)